MSAKWRQHLLTIPGVGVSLLPKVACPLCWPGICRRAEFTWVGIPNFVKISAATYGFIPCACRRSIGIWGKKEAWVLSVFPGHLVWCICRSWKVLFGIKRDYLCGIGGFGDCVCLERVAPSEQSRARVLCSEIDNLRGDCNKWQRKLKYSAQVAPPVRRQLKW